MMNEGMPVFVNVDVEWFDVKTGQRIFVEHGHNRVVTAGRNLLRDLLNGDAISGNLTRFQLGTDATPVSNADTTLGVLELDDFITKKTKSSAQLVVQYYLRTGMRNGITFREAGLMTDADTLYARYVFSTPIEKTAAIAVTFTWTLAFTATGMSINIETGHMVELGGLPNVFHQPSAPNAWRAGSTLDTIAPGTGLWYLDSADLPPGSEYVIEAIVRVEQDGVIPKIAAFDLDSAPNTPLAGSTATGSGLVTGERLRSSSITFPAGGDAKNIGIKVTTNNVAKGGSVAGARFIRIL